MILDPRWAYAMLAGGVVMFLLTILILVFRNAPSGTTGSPFTGLLTWVEGKKTIFVVVAVILLRYVDRRGWIDTQLFTDLQDLLVGGGALTYLSKMNRLEKKQDTAVASADEAASIAATTQATVKAVVKAAPTPQRVPEPVGPREPVISLLPPAPPFAAPVPKDT